MAWMVSDGTDLEDDGVNLPKGIDIDWVRSPPILHQLGFGSETQPHRNIPTLRGPETPIRPQTLQTFLASSLLFARRWDLRS